VLTSATLTQISGLAGSTFWERPGTVSFSTQARFYFNVIVGGPIMAGGGITITATVRTVSQLGFVHWYLRSRGARGVMYSRNGTILHSDSQRDGQEGSNNSANGFNDVHH